MLMSVLHQREPKEQPPINHQYVVAQQMNTCRPPPAPYLNKLHPSLRSWDNAFINISEMVWLFLSSGQTKPCQELHTIFSMFLFCLPLTFVFYFLGIGNPSLNIALMNVMKQMAGFTMSQKLSSIYRHDS